MAVKKLLTFFILISLIDVGGCNKEPYDDPIPYVQFNDIVINLLLPEFNNLRGDGGYVMINGGVRGIILYRENAMTYWAFERNCSFHPNDACATVEVHLSGLYMADPCCSSNFNFPEGMPVSGPAWRPLRKYETILNGSTLTVTNTII